MLLIGYGSMGKLLKTLAEEGKHGITAVIAEADAVATAARLAEKLCGSPPIIPYLTNWGQPLLLGPGSILVAYTKDEFVLKADLTAAAELYGDLVKKLLTGDASGFEAQ